MTRLDIAIHLRDLKGSAPLDRGHAALTELYESAFREEEEGESEAFAFNRIYVGDEFCPLRMPGVRELEAFRRFADERNLPITLLTPVLTDEGLERISPLFDYLNDGQPGAEVVANDWGVLYFLKNRYPSLRLSAGRLLNKAYKDPRLKHPEDPAPGAGEPDPLLTAGTFDHEPVREKMAELGVARLERDILPYQTLETTETTHFKTSCYFPFGHVTSGRICWMASFNQPPENKYIPPRRCGRPCEGPPLELRHETFTFRLYQNGNTIFYLYPPPMLKTLFHLSGREGRRLVFQPFITL